MNQPDRDNERLQLAGLPVEAASTLRWEDLRVCGVDRVASETLEKLSRELRLRSDPDRVAPGGALSLLPWSREAHVRSQAREASLQARLEIFQDELRALRIANELLNRAATMRAVEAAETALFEIRCAGQAARLAILNRAHLAMTRQFVSQLESIESYRGRISDEVLEALKERALNEFCDRMNRASKADVEFSKTEILRLKP